MASGIYRIRNTVNGHAYIGSAANIARRWTAHRHALRHHKKSPPKLQRAWDKHGEAAFVFEVVLECPKDELLTHEQATIDAEAPHYNTRAQAHWAERGTTGDARSPREGGKRCVFLSGHLNLECLVLECLNLACLTLKASVCWWVTSWEGALVWRRLREVN